MMKNNFLLRFVRILSLVFFAALVLNACAGEDLAELHSSHAEQNATMHRVSFDEMNKYFNENGVVTPKSLDSAYNKGTDSYITDIDSASITKITLDNITTFTMRINTPDDSKYEFSNLIIELKNGIKEEYIYHYNPTEEWQSSYEAGEKADYEGELTITDVEGTVVFFGKSTLGTVCFMAVDIPCYGPFCPCSDGNGQTIMVKVDCSGSGGGDPENPTGDGPTTPTGPGGYNPSEGGNGGNSTTNTPCAKIKAQRENTVFQNKIGDLEGKTGLKKETGYIQKNGGDYEYKDNASATDQNNSLSLPNPATNKYIKGYMHTHVDDFEASDGTTRTGIKAMSPADVAYFMDMVKNAQDAARPLGEVYAIMVSSSVNYQIRFTGNQYQIKIFTDAQRDGFRTSYTTFMESKINNQKQLEFGFLYFISEKMNLKGVSLYRMNADGTTTEIQLNADKTDSAETTCPI